MDRAHSGRHEGDIGWDEFEQNKLRLRENAHALGDEREKGPPREGPALLQGLAICAVCGERMTIRHHQRGGCVQPDYVCQRHGIQRAQPICQEIPGGTIDDAIGKLLVEAVTPRTHTVTLPLPKPAWALRQTPSEAVSEIDRLLDDHTDAETAKLLNEGGILRRR